jgi:integrase
LKLRPGGSSSYVWVTTVGGKRREIALGGTKKVSLLTARTRAGQLREAVALGKDPRNAIALKVGPEELAEPAENTLPTFGDWSDEIVTALVPGFKNAKHRQQWTNTLKDHGAALRPLHLDQIDTDAVLGVLRPIWNTTNETASRLRGRIERILDAAKAKGHIKSPWENPARWKGHLEHFLPRKRKKDQKHHAAVAWQAMPKFWEMLVARGTSTSVLALQFTILTAARTTEAIEAKQKEFDLKAKIWTIPAARMKMEIEHQVALSDAAVTIVRQMWPDNPEGYIFPGMRAGRPLSNMAMLMLLKDEMKRTETVHGFRSAFRDWAGDGTEHARELAEMSLAHAVGDAAEQAYRRGKALEKRRVLMDDWATYLAG